MENQNEQTTNFSEEKNYSNYWFEQENWLDCNYATNDHNSEPTYSEPAKTKIEPKNLVENINIQTSNLEQLYAQPDSTNEKRSRNRSKNGCNPSSTNLNLDDSRNTGRKILRPHSTPATLIWLDANYELADSVCIPRSVLYMHYLDFCNQGSYQPVNAASFGKIIRQQFPMLTTRRLGTRGQSRYHYYGIAIKENSLYYQFNYSKKSVQLQSSESTSSKLHNLSKSFITNQNKSGHLMSNINQQNHQKSPTYSRSASDFHCKSHLSRLEAQGSLNYTYSSQASQIPTKALTASMTVSSSCPSSSLSTSGHLLSTTLPLFPTTEELQLEPESSSTQLISTFLLMYRAHCQRVLDSIVRTNFDEVQTLLHHFWNQIPHHLQGILTNNQLLNAIAVCDIRLYSVIRRLTYSSITQTTLSEISFSQLEHFVNNFENAINSALYYSHKHLNALRDIKCRIGQLFCSTMLDLLSFGKNCPFRSDHSAWESFKTNFVSFTFQLDAVDICSKYETILSKLATITPNELSSAASSSPLALSRFATFGVSLRQSICKHLLHLLMTPSGFDTISEWFDAMLSILTQANLTLNQQHHQHQQQQQQQQLQYLHYQPFSLSLEQHFLGLWTVIRAELSNMRWSNTQNRHWNGHKVSEGDIFLIESVLSAFDDFALFKLSETMFDRLSSDFLTSAQQKEQQQQHLNQHSAHQSHVQTTHFDPIGLLATIPELHEWLRQVRSQLNDSPISSITSQYPLAHSPRIATPQSNTHQAMEYSSQYGSLPALCQSDQALQPSVPVATATTTSTMERPLPSLYSTNHTTHNTPSQYGTGQHQLCANSFNQDQTSLICFSMNFHANSIQVMTASQFGSISNKTPNMNLPAHQDSPYQHYHHQHHHHQRHLHHTQNSYYPTHYHSLQNTHQTHQSSLSPDALPNGLYYQAL